MIVTVTVTVMVTAIVIMKKMRRRARLQKVHPKQHQIKTAIVKNCLHKMATKINRKNRILKLRN